VTSDGKLVRFREDSAESLAWSNAYVMTRDLGFVFAAGELAPAVYLACEAVFRQRFGIRTPPTAIDYAKVDSDTVEVIRSRLAGDGFYDDKPADLRPVPSRLRKVDAPGVLKSIADRLRPFQPYATGGGDAGGVDEARLFAWLRQFRTEEVDSALRMLQQLRVLTRAEARSAIELFLKENPAFKGCYLCPLGGPRDSSAVITYFAQDLADGYGLQVATLQEALTAEEARPALFVDDFLGTGRQATTIVKHWIGAPYEGKLDESHGAKLSPLLAEQLKRREVGFAFVYGTTPGQAHLKEELTSAGMKVTVRIHQDESTLPRAFGAGAVEYGSVEAEPRFKVRCEEIGRKLLTHLHGERWGTAKVAERTLGYGNDAYLVVFPYNVPTATLTLLWSEGEVDGASWLPLLPRRKKS
jgi:hypothetical protein